MKPVNFFLALIVVFASSSIASAEPKPLKISIGGAHGCVLSNSGKVTCWGNNGINQSIPPADLRDVEQISAGWIRSCALTKFKKLECWGSRGAPAFKLGPIAQVAAGDENICALDENGKVACSRPGKFQPPADLGHVIQIDVAVDSDDVCALELGGKPRCWGLSNVTEIPERSTEKFSQVAVARGSVCGVKSNGEITCWGEESVSKVRLPADFGQAVKVSVASHHACALDRSGRVACWGSESRSDMPNTLGPAIDLSARYNGACAVLDSGDVNCWGDLGFGLGSPPSSIQGLHAISMHDTRVCGINSSNLVQCFGDYGGTWKPFGEQPKQFKQLAAKFGGPSEAHLCGLTFSGDLECVRTGESDWWIGEPPADLGTVAVIVSGKMGSSCVLLESGNLRCWGGMIEAPKLSGIQQIVAGNGPFCARDAEGKIHCWGDDDLDAESPHDLPPFESFAVGAYHACGLNSGQVYCWVREKAKYKYQVPADLPVVAQIVVASGLSCVVSDKGSVHCWDEDGKWQDVPAHLGKVVSLYGSVNSRGICALNEAGELSCWGDEGVQMFIPAHYQ